MRITIKNSLENGEIVLVVQQTAINNKKSGPLLGYLKKRCVQFLKKKRPCVQVKSSEIARGVRKTQKTTSSKSVHTAHRKLLCQNSRL